MNRVSTTTTAENLWQNLYYRFWQAGQGYSDIILTKSSAFASRYTKQENRLKIRHFTNIYLRWITTMD